MLLGSTWESTTSFVWTVKIMTVKLIQSNLRFVVLL